MKITKRNPLLSIVNDFLIDSPAAPNLTYFWSFGSLLGQNQIIMIITGILQAMHYVANISLAFESTEHLDIWTYGDGVFLMLRDLNLSVDHVF